jgi:hypothetical protein
MFRLQGLWRRSCRRGARVDMTAGFSGSSAGGIEKRGRMEDPEGQSGKSVRSTRAGHRHAVSNSAQQ